MQSTATSRRIICFGAFEIDSSSGELRKSGLRMRLQGQPLEILLLLLDSPGEIVTRDVLRERLWSANTFVDFEHSLNSAVKKLRQALGDNPDNPRFIETVPRKGYRFIAHVTVTPVNGQPQVGAEDLAGSTLDTSRLHPTWNHRKAWIIAVASCIAGIAFAIIVSLRHSKNTPPVQTQIEQITTNASEIPITGSAISPDGKYVAYSDAAGTYLRVIANGETHALALPTGLELRPDAWFPDATRFLATEFVNSRPSEDPSLWIVPVVGSPRKLINNGFSGAISPDGSRISFIKVALDVNGLAGSEIWVMSVDGSEPRLLAKADKGEWLGSVTWAPDSLKVAFIRCRHPGAVFDERTSIQVQSLEAEPPSTLLLNPKIGNALLWTSDGRIVFTLADSTKWGTAFLSWASTAFSIWAMPVRTSTAQPQGPAVLIATMSGDVSRISMTASSDTLSFVNEVKQMDVYISELEPGVKGAKSPRRLTLSDANEVPLAWTPDSRAVIFISDRNHNVNIYRQEIERSTAELIVGGRVNSWTPRLSPDGSQLVYLETPAAGASQELSEKSDRLVRAMKVPLSGGPQQLVLTAPNIGNVECGKIGRCIFSATAKGQTEFFGFDVATGSARKILTLPEDPASCCMWSLSPDGLTLAVAGPVRNGIIRLISLPTKTTRDLVIADWPRLGSSQQPVQGGMDWAADGKGLFLAADIEPSGLSLLYVDLDGHARVLLRGGNARWAIPSPDGRYIALNTFSTVRNVWFARLTSFAGN